MTQAQMFPLTEEERIAILRDNLAAEVEKRLAKRDTAAVALADAEEAEEGARGLLTVFDRMVRDRARQISEDRGGKSILAEVADEVNSGALDRDGITVTADVSTGRVAAQGPGWQLIDPWTCPECHGDGRLPDKTGGGHHKCKACHGTGHQDPSCDNCTAAGCNLKQQVGSAAMGCGGSSWLHGERMGKAAEPYVSVVVALYPGDDEPHVTEIGDHTRYGELVADYFTAAGLTGKHDAKDWSVLAEDELGNLAKDFGRRKLRDVISHDDYGKRLLIAAADQGSVTGTPAEKGAS